MLSVDNIAYRRVMRWLIEVVNGNPLVTPWQSEKMWRLDQWLRSKLRDACNTHSIDSHDYRY